MKPETRKDLHPDPWNAGKKCIDWLKDKKHAQQLFLIKLQQDLLDKADDHHLPFDLLDDKSLQVTRWIGAFQFEDKKLEVVPRLGQDLLGFLFAVILNIRILDNPSAFSLARDKKSHDLLAMAWVALLYRAIQRTGLVKEYQLVREPHSHIVRGRIDIATHIQENLVYRHRIACEYFDQTYNHTLNQLLLKVILHIHQKGIWPFKGVNNDATSRLLDLKDRLITLGASSSDWNRSHEVNWRRHNASYAQVYRSGKLLLTNSGGISSNGLTGFAKSFFFDMAEIWEMFLFEALKKCILEKNKEKEKQGVKELLRISHPLHERRSYEDHSFLMRKDDRHYGLVLPDFILYKGDSIIGILDAKYKAFPTGTTIEKKVAEDLRQMWIYQSRFGFAKGALLYPKREGYFNAHITETYGEGQLLFPPWRKGDQNQDGSSVALSWWLIDVNPMVRTENDENSKQDKKKYLELSKFEEGICNQINSIIDWFCSPT